LREETGWLAGVQGNRIWYGDLGDGEGVPLLLLHGGPGASHDYLEPLARDLARKRRVVMYDQSGGGLSDRPGYHTEWTVDHFIRELEEVVERLVLKEVAVLGQSWGGMLALEYAVRQPSCLRGLILSSSLASSATWNLEARRLVEGLPQRWRDAVRDAEVSGDTSSPDFQDAAMLFYREHVCRLPTWPECLLRTFAKLDEHPELYRRMWGASEFYCTGTLKDWDIRSRLKDVVAPTLLISGEFDEATPKVQEELSQGICDARWIMIRGASHMAHLERPMEYLKAMASFLTRVDRTRSKS
jgi:proline-specific peptidase